jgi:hypothetical protein
LAGWELAMTGLRLRACPAECRMNENGLSLARKGGTIKRHFVARISNL